MKQDERLQTQPNPAQSEAEEDLESVSSQNLIMQSIKEAIVHMDAKQKRLKENPNLTGVYERMIQQLESDVRGHIKVSNAGQGLYACIVGTRDENPHGLLGRQGGNAWAEAEGGPGCAGFVVGLAGNCAGEDRYA